MTTSSVLVPIETGLLPDISEVRDILAVLVAEGARQRIDDARCQLEAHQLYAKQSGFQDRERHFAKLRLLTEAALGVLSFVDKSVIPSSHKRSQWRLLAAAFERGRLEALIADASDLATSRVAWTIRNCGLAHVPRNAFGRNQKLSAYVPWEHARTLAHEKGLDLTSLPVDDQAAKRADKRREAQARRMSQVWEAREKEWDREAKQKIAAMLSDRDDDFGRSIGSALSWIRRITQALDRARVAETENQVLDQCIALAYRLEDELKLALSESVALSR